MPLLHGLLQQLVLSGPRLALAVEAVDTVETVETVEASTTWPETDC